MKKLFAFLAAALIAAPAFGAEYPDISVTELKTAIEAKKVTVIDVNGSDSYKKGHVPTSINFAEAKDELASKLPADKDALVVAYCGSEKCSAYKRAAQAAKDLGYTNVKHLSAGLKGWKEAGEKTEAAE
ncbi:rhodanese-like domain-containing protein [Phragmitibacter flavus]|uniref:Rhodanese-like domain-containing protein n=1 Tax=Phragmitibacter flavus TaxID=2576071 RepID=A0A5R8KCK6_9BACT|nr:rhodanese-like domain-containing protein [Phragmitibacter flavus]TLD70032.1 rhodanese-like domain-containing protein [Phragmitibacter flavus]